MSQPAKAQEPSMEEILASIRRIISDDDAGKSAAVKPAPMPAPAVPVAKNSQDDIDAMLAGFDEPPDDGPDGAGATEAEIAADVLELTEAMQASAPVLNGIEHSTDRMFGELPEPEPPRVPEEPRATPMLDRPLLSPRATAAVDNAFNSL